MPQEPTSEGNEKPASVINAGGTWKRMSEHPNIHRDSCYNIKGIAMPGPNHSAKYGNKINKAYT